MAAKKYTYVWVSFIVLIFGILVIPSIVDRFTSGAVVTSERLSIANNSGDLALLPLMAIKEKCLLLVFTIRTVYLCLI